MQASKTHLRQQFNRQKIALAKALLLKGNNSNRGLTLLECLVSIMVVTAVIATITPAIFLTVATRVQNRRASQAQQLAQAQIDAVRRIVDRGDYTSEKLPPPDAGGARELSQLSTIPVNPDPNPNGVWKRCVDIDGNGECNYGDFLVVTFRNAGVPEPVPDPADPSKPVAFSLGVRVYSYFPQGQGQTFGTEPASLGWTTATGSQTRRPLVTLYTNMAVSDSSNSMSRLCLQAGGDETRCNR